MAWTAALAAPYNSDTRCVFATDGSVRKRFEGMYAYEWGIDAPDIYAYVASGSGSGLTGKYNAVYTYARKERAAVVCESNPSQPYAEQATLSGNDLLIYAFAPSDEQVNCIRFYRTTNDGATYYWTADLDYCNRQYSCTYDFEEDGGFLSGPAYRFTVFWPDEWREVIYSWESIFSKYSVSDTGHHITTLADNIYHDGTQYTTRPMISDVRLDAALGTAVERDHHRPPENGAHIFGPTSNGTLFMCVGHRVYYSKPGQPEYWPATYYVDVSVPQYPLVAGIVYDDGPYVFDVRGAYYLQPAIFQDTVDASKFKATRISTVSGAASREALDSKSGFGVFHATSRGVYVYGPSGDSKITEMFEPAFLGEDARGVAAVGDLGNCWLIWHGEKLYFGYCSTADTTPKRVMVFDPARKKASYYEFPFTMAFVGRDEVADTLLVLADDGKIWEIENKNNPDRDGDAPITWEIQTKDFTLQTRLHYPRWNKYDIDATEADEVYADCYLDGAIVHTHRITGARDTRRRLLPICNGNRYSVKLRGSGVVAIYALESE